MDLKIKKPPLKYLELQLGYHTEGFKRNEQEQFPEAKTELQFGVGLGLSELIFKPINKNRDNAFIHSMDTFFRYYRLPGTYIATEIQERVE